MCNALPHGTSSEDTQVSLIPDVTEICNMTDRSYVLESATENEWGEILYNCTMKKSVVWHEVIDRLYSEAASHRPTGSLAETRIFSLCGTARHSKKMKTCRYCKPCCVQPKPITLARTAVMSRPDPTSANDSPVKGMSTCRIKVSILIT